MNALLAFYHSSIGKKVFMSLTGLFLCTFLLEHAIGNFLLFFGKEVYDGYTELMVNNPLIRTVEIGLFLSLLVHPVFGSLLWFYNKRARPEKYEEFRLKDNTPWASRSTMLTGLIILGFLLLHLYSFFYKMRFSGTHLSGYLLVVQKFQDPLFVLIYIVCIVLLGYHLKHGFQSAFQTLGLRNRKYTGLIDAIAFVFWFLIPGVFIAIPIVFYLWPPVVSGAVTAFIF